MSFRMLFRNALPQAYQAFGTPSAVLLDAQLLPRSLAAGARFGQWLAAPQAQELTRLQAQRSFTTTEPAQNSLLSVLQEESAFEKEDYVKPTALSSVPQSWKLEDTPGKCVIALTSQHEGEAIRVEVDVDEQEEEPEYPMEEEEAEQASQMTVEEEESDNSILFRVHVAKGNQALVFDCQSDGTYLTVLHAALEPANADEDEERYDGPVFNNLDEKLQIAFREYLEERGVNEALGAFLVSLCEDKEQREYMSWLENVAKFVQK